MITGKQRIFNAINHQFSDRLPMDLWADMLTVEKLEQNFSVHGIDNVRKALDTDFFYVEPRPMFIPNPPDENNEFTDEWGVVMRLCKNSFGSYTDSVRSPLADMETVAEIDRYPWPSPGNFDYSDILHQCEANAEYAIQGGRGHFFCPGADLRGYENWLIDIIEESSVGIAIMEHMTDYWVEYTERVIQASQGKVDVLHLADDYSSQLGLIISPQSWRNFFRPYLKRMIDLGKKHGLKIFFHSCGAVRQLIPDLIDIGIDILNPIQIRAAGMVPEELCSEFGRDICFHGGVDLQHTLPFGTRQDVRDEVCRLMNTLGKYGGYIVAPGHTIQSDTPLENVLEIYRTVKELK